MSATGERPRAGEQGATLLEMMVVVGVLALTATVVFADLRRPYTTLSGEAARSSVAAALRDARSHAIREQRTVVFELGQDGRSYGWGARSVRLPASTRAEMAPAAMSFAPDGGSGGGRVALWRGLRPIGAVEVAPGTGVVSLGASR